ncbi:unnamed protein product, partial [Meganyctiphanes norvegica]
MSSKILKFEHISDFEKWKAEEEKKKFINYVALRGKTFKGSRPVTFYCRRSGTYRLHRPLIKKKRKRFMRSQGSCKMGMYCTSTIEVYKEDSYYTVKYYPNHFGHNVGKLALCFMNMLKEDEKFIARQKVQGIPDERILENIEKTAHFEERSVRITKQHIRNITNRYIEKKHRFHKDDNVSVQIFANQLKLTNELLYHKQIGEVDLNNPGIPKDAYVLAFMFDAQKELLKTHLETNEHVTKICTDSTHNICQYEGFKLTAMLYVTDLNNGMPFAFLVSNTLTEEVFKVYVESIKTKFRPIFAHTFMTDDDPVFRNGWKLVMPQIFRSLQTKYSTFYLNCDWHTDKAFQKNVKEKVKGDDDQASIYDNLKTMMNELDETLFLKACEIFKFFLMKKKLDDFLKYFETYVEPKAKLWAKCYRTECSIHSNMYMEGFHKNFKYYFLNGKKNKRLDAALGGMRDFVKSAARNRKIALLMGETNVSGRKGVVRQHNIGIEMDVVQRDHSEWIVSTPLHDEEFVVFAFKHYSEICYQHRDRCPECRICSCHYNCDCKNNLIYKTCEHVHAVAHWRYEKDRSRPVEDFAQNESEIQMIESVTEPSNTSNKIHVLKNELETINLTLMKRVALLEDISPIEEIIKSLQRNVLVAEAYQTNFYALPLPVEKKTLTEPGNKKIEPQNRFKMK